MWLPLVIGHRSCQRSRNAKPNLWPSWSASCRPDAVRYSSLRRRCFNWLKQWSIRKGKAGTLKPSKESWWIRRSFWDNIANNQKTPFLNVCVQSSAMACPHVPVVPVLSKTQLFADVFGPTTPDWIILITMTISRIKHQLSIMESQLRTAQCLPSHIGQTPEPSNEPWQDFDGRWSFWGITYHGIRQDFFLYLVGGEKWSFIAGHWPPEGTLKHIIMRWEDTMNHELAIYCRIAEICRMTTMTCDTTSRGKLWDVIRSLMNFYSHLKLMLDIPMD